MNSLQIKRLNKLGWKKALELRLYRKGLAIKARGDWMRTEYIHFDGLEDESLETRIVEKLLEIFITDDLFSCGYGIKLNDELMSMLAKYRSRLTYLNKLYNYEQKQLEVE